MSFCEVNTAQPNQLTTMDESIDSGNVRRSLRSNVRCNYKDMINGTKKNSNAIDRSRSLSVGKKLKIKPVIPKKNQTCGEVSCNSSHNNSSDVNNTFRTTKSASHTTTTDDEATTNSNQSLSVSPENNIHHVIEVTISTTDPTTNSKRHRRPPSAHKDYLNEKQVKEIQKNYSKNPSKSLTPDPNTVINSSKLLSSDNGCKKIDNNNLNINNQTQKCEIANEIQKKVNNTMNNTSNILEVEINKDVSGDEPRCSLSPPLKMSITRGKGSVSPKIISFTVNEADIIVKEDQSLQGADKNETKSNVIPTIPVEENELLPTVEEIKEFNSHSNEDGTTDKNDLKNPISKEELTENIPTDSIDLKCSENPALLQIDVPETAKTNLVEEVPNEKVPECPTLQCMDKHTDPPKLELENNEQKPELESIFQDTFDQQEESTTTNQPMDTSGPPLLEPVEEGPKEDSYEDLDLKCHEDLELMDLDTPKKVDVDEEETETMDTTTSPIQSTKTGKRRNCPTRKDTPTEKIETKTSGRRSYSRNSDKYKCKECGFTTGRMVDLKLHNKTHENNTITRGTSAKRRKRSHSVPKQDTALNEIPKEEAESGDKDKEIEYDKLYSIEECNLESGTKDGSPSHEKIYKCKECPFTNTNISRIESHVIGHTKRIGFKCPVCTYFCGSAGFMKKHTSLHGSDCPWPPQFYGSKRRGNGRYQTPPPTLTRDDEGLKKEVGDEETSKEYSHQQSLNGGDNKKFSSQGGNNKRGVGGSQVVPLTDDMRTIWKSMNIQKKLTKQTCSIKTCSFTGTSISFSLHKLLYTHKKDKVKPKTKKPAPLDKKVKKKKDNKKSGKIIKKVGRKLICKDCKRKFINRKNLHSHKIIKYLNLNKTEKLKFKRMVVEATDILKEHDGIFYCLECPFWGTNFSVTETHAKGHLEKFTHCCDKCQWSADDEIEIKVHEQWHSSEVMINDENEEVMNGNNVWNCDECPYKTHDVYEMRSHTRLHQGQRSQRCSHCTFSCDGPGALSQHLQIHGKVTKRGKPKRQTIKREPITDKIVSKEVMSKTENGLTVKALKLVIKSATLKETYEMHKCETCPYYAASEDSIFKHVALHILPKGGRTMQECLDCEFYCESSEVLKEHVRVHNNAFIIPYFIQTLFSCKICDFTSSEEAVLKNHEQKCSKERVQGGTSNYTNGKKPYRGRKRKAPEDEDTPPTDNSTREVSTEDADSMTLDDWLKEYHKKFGLPRTVIETKTKTVVKERPRHNVLNLYASRVNCANDGNYNCISCPFTTRFQAVMRAHETHHRYTQQHNCSICSYSVNDVRNLMNHLKWHEVDGEVNNVEKKAGMKKHGPYKALTSRVGSGSHQYECPFNPCTFKSPFGHSLNAHISDHAKKHKLRIFTALKRKNGDILKNEKTFKPPKESKNPLMCGECQFSTHFSDDFFDHQEAHRDIYLEYQCTICSFGSDSLVYLNTHLTDHHTDEVKNSADLTNFNERQHRFKLYLDSLTKSSCDI